MKLALLGGGGFRTPIVHAALLRDTGTPRIDDVALHDVDPARLDVVRRVLARQAEGHRHPPRVTVTTDLDAALRGADVVFAAVRPGGAAGRVLDERVALDLGVLGQETVGPGGIAFALRTVPVMVDVARRVRALAPDAFVVDFTNPAGIVTEAMRTVLGDRVVGICDTPSGLGRRLAAALGVPADEVELDYVGLNHLGWMRRVLHRGRDLLPGLLADDAALAGVEEAQVFGAPWLRATGCVPNEYLYYLYRQREAVAAVAAAPETRGEYLVRTQDAFFAAAPAAPDPLALWRDTVRARDASYMAEARGPHAPAAGPDPGPDPDADPEQQGYAGVALAVMLAVLRGEPARAVLNVGNGTTVAGLPADAVVEVPCLVDGSGAHPLAVPPPDVHQLGLMAAVKAVERHVVAAALTGSREQALLAFALHPTVASRDTGAALLAGYTAAHPALRELLVRP